MEAATAERQMTDDEVPGGAEEGDTDLTGNPPADGGDNGDGGDGASGLHAVPDPEPSDESGIEAPASGSGEQPQTALDERVIQDPEFEKLLGRREEAKRKKAEATKKYAGLDTEAKEKLEELGLKDGQAFRVGRFRCTAKPVPSRAVAFETDPTTRINIGVVDS